MFRVVSQETQLAHVKKKNLITDYVWINQINYLELIESNLSHIRLLVLVIQICDSFFLLLLAAHQHCFALKLDMPVQIQSLQLIVTYVATK